MGNTKITIGELVNDKSLLAKAYSVQPEVIELLAKCAITYLNRKEHPKADKVIEAMQTLAPRHPEVLYLFGMRQLE
ncbi:hypothetical protein D1822_09685 [Phaeobacter inhibens]|uniref:hypothetical protein n=1 Tax=Phaeobacter inhibens TaxID=221822 RepID=UPI0001632A88|nr:hypothetical protein [Phaeobacter inhibens]AFO91695.1 hypothetical protein PGA1_c20060 [Phaeobacter inhibens DSM 17395]AUQ46362.1 hypothetical protein PhaeoP10_02025 [Phaeobacter inhibens]AXT23079.1 hypothetical protein D1822_09685 [Phaeobacter inhibens]